MVLAEELMKVLLTFSMMKSRAQRTISWNPDINPETEDRKAFLELSPLERWEHIMAVVLATYPGGPEAVTYEKRQIEWK